jgi:error-prone DNA polymerase
MFTHLHTHSPYSFQDGASSIETLVARADRLGMSALALTDHNSVTAAVKFTQTCAGYGVRPILGAEVLMEDGSHLTLLAQNPTGYANLCRLLTKAFYHGGRLSPALPWSEIPVHTEGLICLSGCRKGRVPSLVRNHRYDQARTQAVRLRDWFGRGHFFLELQCDFIPKALQVSRDLVELGQRIGVGVVATNNVHHATSEDAVAHEILRCIGTSTRVDQIHIDRPLNAERYLKSEREMLELFSWCPEAIQNTEAIADMCGPALPEPADVTPSYPVPEKHGCTAMEYLCRMTEQGAKHRWKSISDGLRRRLDEELKVIEAMGFADYFLTCWDIVRWCRKPEQKIRVTGRGSAADSAVAYALHLTDVDAHKHHLPFARFMALAEGLNKAKIPDIDLDFPNSRRDEVFAYLLQRYGENHVAQVCTYSTFWARSAVRDIGKAMQIPSDVLSAIGSNLHHWLAADEIEQAFTRPELRGYAHLKEPCQQLFSLCRRIAGHPRHLSKHSSGVIISRVPLDTIGVISPQASGVLPVLMFDKEDAPDLGLIKVDILALGIHSAIADTEAELTKRPGKQITYDRIPRNDRETYKMIRGGHAVGAFQCESAAERAYAVKLGPEHIDDLAAIIAQIRPGPVRSGVTKEFIKLRNGLKQPGYIPPELVPVLGPTYGLVIYQEQVSSVIAYMWKSSDADADRFRKSLARHDKLDTMDKAEAEFVRRTLMARPEFSAEKAAEVFQKSIMTWCSYGFTEGHARSFADIAERSAYFSVHHPAEFFAGLMSNQPMGYYAPMTLATEARWRGVEVLPVDVNESFDKCTTPDEKTIRLGFKLVTGLREEDREAIVAERGRRPFASLLDFCARVSIHRDRLETLILAGAFDQLHERHRKGMLWALPETQALARSYKGEGIGGQGAFSWPVTHLETPIAWDVPRLSAWEDYVLTWRLTGVGPGAHPFAYFRSALKHLDVSAIEEVQTRKSQQRVRTAGLNIRPHRPPTREGHTVLYTILEDEKRHLQCSCSGDALDRCTPTLITCPAVIAEGPVYRQGSGWTMHIEEVEPINMTRLVELSREIEEQVVPTERELVTATDGTGDWHMGYNVPTRPKSLPTTGTS